MASSSKHWMSSTHILVCACSLYSEASWIIFTFLPSRTGPLQHFMFHSYIYVCMYVCIYIHIHIYRHKYIFTQNPNMCFWYNCGYRHMDMYTMSQTCKHTFLFDLKNAYDSFRYYMQFSHKKWILTLNLPA